MHKCAKTAQDNKQRIRQTRLHVGFHLQQARILILIMALMFRCERVDELKNTTGYSLHLAELNRGPFPTTRRFL